jgi:hypothetical protein
VAIGEESLVVPLETIELGQHNIAGGQGGVNDAIEDEGADVRRKEVRIRLAKK